MMTPKAKHDKITFDNEQHVNELDEADEDQIIVWTISWNFG